MSKPGALLRAKSRKMRAMITTAGGGAAAGGVESCCDDHRQHHPQQVDRSCRCLEEAALTEGQRRGVGGGACGRFHRSSGDAATTTQEEEEEGRRRKVSTRASPLSSSTWTPTSTTRTVSCRRGRRGRRRARPRRPLFFSYPSLLAALIIVALKAAALLLASPILPSADAWSPASLPKRWASGTRAQATHRHRSHRPLLRLSSSSTTTTSSSPNDPDRRSSRRRMNRKATRKVDADAALAIVPPDEAWDTLQRARYLANDKSYTRWPPCIRLFHPFVRTAGGGGEDSGGGSDVEDEDIALKVASIVERHGIEPFEIKLDRWSVLPHAEVLHADWQAMKRMPAQRGDFDDDDDAGGGGGDPGTSLAAAEEQERLRVERLIAYHEREGRINKRRREQRRLAKLGLPYEPDSEEEEDEASAADEDKLQKQQQQQADSPRELIEKQKRKYEEFNGPCVVCLEPDPKSKRKLQEIRELLEKEIFGSSATGAGSHRYYSPTLSVTPESLVSAAISDDPDLPPVLSDGLEEYRPLIPVAAFPTVTSAIAMARKLSRLWTPLAFNVTDLHLISTAGGCAGALRRGGGGAAGRGGGGSGGGAAEAATVNYLWKEQERHLECTAQVGCDALVMLVGEEVDPEPEAAWEMAQLVYQKGEAGGHSSNKNRNDGDGSSGNAVAGNKEIAKAATNPIFDDLDLDGNDGDVSELQQWLDGDDDDEFDVSGGYFNFNEDEFDDGSVVVIGRTHFFTGQQRLYVGMPATSSKDGKDRVLSESAVAKRRGAVHRSPSKRRADGGFGRVEDDYSPYSSRERTARRDALAKLEAEGMDTAQ